MAPINRNHAQYVTDHACAQLRWLNRVCERLPARGYTLDDPLLRAALNASNAMHGLRVQSMYLAMPRDPSGKRGKESGR